MMFGCGRTPITSFIINNFTFLLKILFGLAHIIENVIVIVIVFFIVIVIVVLVVVVVVICVVVVAVVVLSSLFSSANQLVWTRT